MNKAQSSRIFAIAALIILAGCSTLQTAGHKYLMRGQVLEASDGFAYLCVGTAEGAQRGQQLAAYRFVSDTRPIPRGSETVFKRVKTGIVEIVEVVDEHYARAKIVSGDVREGNLVELEP